DDVELAGSFRYEAKLQKVERDRIREPRAQAQRDRANLDEIGGRLRATRGKQRDRVPTSRKLLGKIRNHPLGTTVVLWRNALVQGREHGNAHVALSSVKKSGVADNQRGITVGKIRAKWHPGGSGPGGLLPQT